MARIRFITSGEISYSLPGKTLYQSIKEASLGKNFPGLVSGAEKTIRKAARSLKKPDLVVAAPSHQASETAQILADCFGAAIKEDNRLLPLRFDIGKFMSKGDFDKLGTQGFDGLRYSFINAFFKNNLLDDNKEIKKRFKSLKRDYQEGEMLLVSHAFLIKLLEIYSLMGDRMYKDRKELVELFGPDKPPLGRLELIDIEV